VRSAFLLQKPQRLHRHGNRRLLDGSNGARTGVELAWCCARTASYRNVLGFNFTAVLLISMRFNRRNSEPPPAIGQELPPIIVLPRSVLDRPQPVHEDAISKGRAMSAEDSPHFMQSTSENDSTHSLSVSPCIGNGEGFSHWTASIGAGKYKHINLIRPRWPWSEAAWR
jgi:hypothetical protein